jgi:hypothetical protein
MRDDFDKLADYLDAQSGWQPSNPENRRYLLKYDPDAQFGWRRISFAEVRKYDICKVFKPNGVQIGEDGERCDPDMCFVAGGDAQKAIGHGWGYAIPTGCFITFDEIERRDAEHRAQVDQLPPEAEIEI